MGLGLGLLRLPGPTAFVAAEYSAGLYLLPTSGSGAGGVRERARLKMEVAGEIPRREVGGGATACWNAYCDAISI